jgi:hypothetical protein
MRITSVLVSCVMVLSLCTSSGNSADRPVSPIVNVPMCDRQSNWLGDLGEGSCVHATMVSLFRWQGMYNTAYRWKKTHGNGEWPSNLERQLDDAGIRYTYVTNGDVSFIEWACSTRRGCGITVNGGSHMVVLVHLDAKWSAILDNNDTKRFIWIPRDVLIDEWQRSRGWAVTPVYTPAAPLPR